jgi:hypothetical protein
MRQVVWCCKLFAARERRVGASSHQIGAHVRQDCRVRRHSSLLGLCVIACVTACSPSPPTPEPSTEPATPPPTTVLPSSTALPSTPAETAAVGFAFDSESIAGYYETLGYRCSEPRPSTEAAGYQFRSCTFLDPDSRTRTVGLITDPEDELADAFASIEAKEGEAILDPEAALDPLAAFLGATLGGTQGESLLPWLAGHLGDAYTTTSIADLTVATYTASPQDHSTLTVEIANAAYLASPRPSESAAPSS